MSNTQFARYRLKQVSFILFSKSMGLMDRDSQSRSDIFISIKFFVLVGKFDAQHGGRGKTQ